MTSRTVRPRWWSALRSGACFFVGGSLGTLVYRLVSHRMHGPLPWGGLMFGVVVATIASGLFSGGRQRRR